MLLFILSSCSSAESKYNNGVEAMNNGEWDNAIEYFSDVDYNNSKELLEKCITEKGMHENSDYLFLETMAESLMKRYEDSKNIDDAEILAETELEMISEFKDKPFYDKELKELALVYIEGVENEKNSFSAENGRKQLKYYEGHAKRFEVLKKLTDNYDFLKDNSDYKANYYNKAETEMEYLTAFKEIESDLDKQQFDAYYVDDITCRIEIQNNTKYNYNMMVHFTFYDSKGAVAGTFENYYEDIISGKKYNLDFYPQTNFSTFDYYTEEYVEL